MTDGWTLAAEARNAYADLVDGLETAQTKAPTMCGSWDVHHVTGHLASFVDVGFGGFFLNMARHRFDYDRAAETLAQRMAERPMADLVASLRSKASKRSAIPIFPGEMTAMDVTVHSQDVRRALGIDGVPGAEQIQSALRFLTTHKQASSIIGKGTLDGLTFEATDLGWSHGDGPAVSGRAEALLMGMTGRPVWDELSGDGVDTLRERFAAR